MLDAHFPVLPHQRQPNPKRILPERKPHIPQQKECRASRGFRGRGSGIRKRFLGCRRRVEWFSATKWVFSHGPEYVAGDLRDNGGALPLSGGV